MRILLTGRNGQVGWELERALPALGEVIATDRATLDLADSDAIRRVVREAKPDVIVNAAAYTAVDKAESQRELAAQVNGVAPGVLAEEAKRLGALLIHYSTDYVFGGEKRTPYTEDDTPNPVSHYAISKLHGERAIATSGCRYLILRTSWVYGVHARNFYQLIARKARANEPIQMVNDQTSVPTPSVFLALQTANLVRRHGLGLVHLVPSGQATRYDFACAVVKAIGSSSPVQAVASDAFPTPAYRPAYSVLDNHKAVEMLGRRLEHWLEALSALCG